MSNLTQPHAFDQKKRLLVVQVLSIVSVATLLLSRPLWSENTQLHELIESAGLVAILICMFGRLWSILFVGSRKNSELVTTGPYSITRNPLYLFSTIGVFGVGLVFGSLTVALVLGLTSYLVFLVTAKKEANFLRASFPGEYASYETVTPLFWPNLSLYSQSSEMTFSPKALQRTFIDALYFLALFPVIEGIEYLQTMGYLPTLFWLP